MSKYDMLIITGLPRSGTTFINNMFATCVFGDQYYAHHSNNSRGSSLRHPLHLCESQIVDMMFSHKVRLENILHILCRFWRQSVGDQEKIMVYKHPNIILQAPFSMHRGWQVKYIICVRENYEEWRKSFIGFNGHIGIHVDAIDSQYEKYWPGKWDEPESWDQRMELLYKMFMDKAKEFNNDELFCYSNDNDILRKEINKLILRFDNRYNQKNVGARAKALIDMYWRKPI